MLNISINNDPIETKLYALELGNLDEHVDIQILTEMCNIWAQKFENIIQLCRLHYSLNYTLFGTILYYMCYNCVSNAKKKNVNILAGGSIFTGVFVH